MGRDDLDNEPRGWKTNQTNKTKTKKRLCAKAHAARCIEMPAFNAQVGFPTCRPP